MKQNKLKIIFLIFAVVLTTPLINVLAAGGGIEGKVTDPKGAPVAGATVTVTNSTTNQKFTARTDTEGRYKIENLPTGVYALVVSAPGFSELGRDSVKVEDGAAATLDLKLEIAPG